jgi:hypothetical protein
LLSNVFILREEKNRINKKWKRDKECESPHAVRAQGERCRCTPFLSAKLISKKIYTRARVYV